MAGQTKDVPVAGLGKGLGLGLGLRYSHIDQILAGEARVDWFEAISENYMDAHGQSLRVLKQVAERYPVVLHGVSMSIGSTDPLNFDYLHKLKKLCAEIGPRWVSDHLCWTGVLGLNTHDLLPVPLNEDTLRHVAQRVNVVQDFLGRQLVLENPSTYLRFTSSTIGEADFLRAVTEETGCGLLLDVNNVYVSSYNAGTDPWDYLKAFPFERVVQMHLAGHQDYGTHVIDTHDQPVRKEVWDLFRYAWNQTGGASTCLEWDGNIPSLEQCEAEIFKAHRFIVSSQEIAAQPVVAQHESSGISTPIDFIVPGVMASTVGDIA